MGRARKNIEHGFDPYQRQHQITIPSSSVAKARGVEMIDWTRQRRVIQGRSFNKQSFYNCVILGLYDIEKRRDVTQEDIDAHGLLAVVVDRGADELNRLIASGEAPTRRRGAPVAIDMDDERDDVEAEDVVETPTRRETPSRPPGFVVPRNWRAARNRARFDARDRAEEETKSPRDRPIP